MYYIYVRIDRTTAREYALEINNNSRKTNFFFFTYIVIYRLLINIRMDIVRDFSCT